MKFNDLEFDFTSRNDMFQALACSNIGGLIYAANHGNYILPNMQDLEQAKQIINTLISLTPIEEKRND